MFFDASVIQKTFILLVPWQRNYLRCENYEFTYKIIKIFLSSVSLNILSIPPFYVELKLNSNILYIRYLLMYCTKRSLSP